MDAKQAMHAIRRFLNGLSSEVMDECWQEIEILLTDLEWDAATIQSINDSNWSLEDRDSITTIPAWAERDSLGIAISALDEIASTMPYSMSMVLSVEDGFAKSRAQVVQASRTALKALEKIR